MVYRFPMAVAFAAILMLTASTMAIAIPHVSGNEPPKLKTPTLPPVTGKRAGLSRPAHPNEVKAMGRQQLLRPVIMTKEEREAALAGLAKDVRPYRFVHVLSPKGAPVTSPAMQCDYTTSGSWDTEAHPTLEFVYDARYSGMDADSVERLLYHAYDTWVEAAGPGSSIPKLVLKPYWFAKTLDGKAIKGADHPPLHPSSMPVQPPHPDTVRRQLEDVKGTSSLVPPKDHRPAYRDGINELSFAPCDTTHMGGMPEHAIAETYVWRSTSTKRLHEADVVFRMKTEDHRFHWIDGGRHPTALDKHCSDFLAIATAQFGHVLGIDQSRSHDHTMSLIATPADASKATLECGDIQAIRSLYPCRDL